MSHKLSANLTISHLGLEIESVSDLAGIVSKWTLLFLDILIDKVYGKGKDLIVLPQVFELNNLCRISIVSSWEIFAVEEQKEQPSYCWVNNRDCFEEQFLWVLSCSSLKDILHPSERLSVYVILWVLHLPQLSNERTLVFETWWCRRKDKTSIAFVCLLLLLLFETWNDWEDWKMLCSLENGRRRIVYNWRHFTTNLMTITVFFLLNSVAQFRSKCHNTESFLQRQTSMFSKTVLKLVLWLTRYFSLLFVVQLKRSFQKSKEGFVPKIGLESDDLFTGDFSFFSLSLLWSIFRSRNPFSLFLQDPRWIARRIFT